MEAQRNLGIALDKLGRTDEALDSLRQGHRPPPDRRRGALSLGLALERVGENAEAERAFRDA
jgi:Flp pilus assembly protein TadD